jgi:GNAT superfamily N-acetyltransferase
MPYFEVCLNTERSIPARAVRQLYDCEAWWPERTESEIAAVLERTLAAGAWHGERLVGFARAISDGRFRAIIEDVVVHPEYRQAGIGSLLIATLLEALSSLDTVSLFCDPELVPFYAREGFRRHPSHVVMHYRPAGPKRV